MTSSGIPILSLASNKGLYQSSNSLFCTLLDTELRTCLALKANCPRLVSILFDIQ